MNQSHSTSPPARSRRPPGLKDVEYALALATAAPAEVGEAARLLGGLSSQKVRAAVRERWVAPEYECLWRSLADASSSPLRIHCLELAAASRWSRRRQE